MNQTKQIPYRDIFISYRHDDWSDAKLTVEYLKKYGYDVFWDEDLHEEQLPNGEFPPVLEEQVRHCIDFVLIISKSTFDGKRIKDPDDWIAKEIGIALENSRHIVPFIKPDAEYPQESVLPEKIKPIAAKKQIEPFPIGRDDLTDDEIRVRLTRNLTSIGNERRTSGPSGYTPEGKAEIERLKVQAENTFPFDMEILNRILNENPERKFNVLDIGCAWGVVGLSRFAGDRFATVLGIDKKEECINYAIEYAADKNLTKFRYQTIDLEVDFEDHLVPVLLQCFGETEVDIIFASLVLHHLKNPSACIRILRKHLKPGGYIIVRGSDDQTKIAGTEEATDLIRKIVKETSQIKGMADRSNGSKIFNWLQSTGFDQVKIYSHMRDTSEMSTDEREALFKESFGWRKLEGTEEDKKRKRFVDLRNQVDELENLFDNPGFWYCEYDYIGVGRKR